MPHKDMLPADYGAVLPERLAWQVLRQALGRLNAALGRGDPMPRLRFDLRGRSAGQALLGDWCIRLNASLLQTHGEAFVRDTVPHELAHLVAHVVHGPRIRPHGPEWRELMRLLGQPPTVCHNYAVTPARRVQRYAYRCGCREHELSSIRHRRILQGQRYQCRSCGGELQAC